MKTVILDTDIGYDPDDLFALLLLLKSPEADINLIVTGNEVRGKRAIFLKKVLELAGRQDIKVVQGEDLGNKGFIVNELITDSDYKVDSNYIAAIKSVLDKFNSVTYIGIDGFTNLANFLRKYPNARKKLKVYQMGGAINYSRRPNWVEHNIEIDKESARFVISSGVDISLVMAQTTFNPVYIVDNHHSIFKRLKSSDNAVYRLLIRHCELFYKEKGWWPYMHDPLTVAEALGNNFVTFYKSSVYMDKYGNLSLSQKGPKLRLSKAESKDKEFMKFLEQKLFG